MIFCPRCNALLILNEDANKWECVDCGYSKLIPVINPKTIINS